MRTEYYGSVKVTYFDKDVVWQALAELAQGLPVEHPEIEKIIVFGSLVRDEAVPGSDVDLLIVVSETDIPFLDRTVEYRPGGFPVGLDVFVYTPAEMEQMLSEGNWFLKRALGEGRTLFTRTDPDRFAAADE
jgi:hypothetical protein